MVTNGVDGVLVPPADPQALAEELQLLAHEPERIKAMGEAGRRSAERYAWPRIAEEVDGGLRAGDGPCPAPIWPPRGDRPRAPDSSGSTAAASAPAKRLPSLEPAPSRRRAAVAERARKAGVAVASILGLGLTALAARRIGVDQVASNIIDSDLKWVLIACALMVAAMFARAASWVAIARAALPAATCAAAT